MHNRRMLALVLAILSVLALAAACGPKQPVPGGETKPENSKAENNQEEQKSEAPEISAYVVGVRTDVDWTSEWLGLKYTLPENMAMLSDDQILEAMEAGNEMLYTDGDDIDYSKLDMVYEMAAANSLTGDNLSILVEKGEVAKLTEAEYMDVFKQTLDLIDTTEVEIVDEGTGSLVGLAFHYLDYKMDLNGQDVYQSILLRKEGDRMVTITLTYWDQDALETMMDGFSAL